MQIPVCVINIGNELLSGRTVNTNLNWLGNELAEIGLPIIRGLTLPDNPELIQQALREEWQRYQVVIVTGGLGPTNDDVTRQVIAEFFGKELCFDDQVWEKVQRRFTDRGLETPQINRSQTMIPDGFTALANRMGTAPGLFFRENEKYMFALPGVPLEMKTIFTEEVKPLLQDICAGQALHFRTLLTWNITESALAEKLQEIVLPQDIEIAWLPQTGRVNIRLSGRNKDFVKQVTDEVHNLIKDYVWGTDEETPASLVRDLMLKQGLTLAVAESCTGGYVQQLLTSAAGASDYFLGGVVSYSNLIKQSVLSAKMETIGKYGAVSRETAIQMAKGIKKVFSSDIGISVTGIAGPAGGTEQKPVGTVWFAIEGDGFSTSEVQCLLGDRDSIRFKAAEYVILLLLKFLRGIV